MTSGSSVNTIYLPVNPPSGYNITLYNINNTSGGTSITIKSTNSVVKQASAWIQNGIYYTFNLPYGDFISFHYITLTTAYIVTSYYSNLYTITNADVSNNYLKITDASNTYMKLGSSTPYTTFYTGNPITTLTIDYNGYFIETAFATGSQLSVNLFSPVGNYGSITIFNSCKTTGSQFQILILALGGVFVGNLGSNTYQLPLPYNKVVSLQSNSINWIVKSIS